MLEELPTKTFVRPRTVSPQLPGGFVFTRSTMAGADEHPADVEVRHGKPTRLVTGSVETRRLCVVKLIS